MPQGKGTYASGIEYEGEWLHGDAHGHGTLVWPAEPDRSEVEGSQAGEGASAAPSSRSSRAPAARQTYTGELRYGRPWEGVLTRADGQIVRFERGERVPLELAGEEDAGAGGDAGDDDDEEAWGPEQLAAAEAEVDFPPYQADTSRPSPRTKRTRLVFRRWRRRWRSWRQSGTRRRQRGRRRRSYGQKKTCGRRARRWRLARRSWRRCATASAASAAAASLPLHSPRFPCRRAPARAPPRRPACCLRLARGGGAPAARPPIAPAARPPMNGSKGRRGPRLDFLVSPAPSAPLPAAGPPQLQTLPGCGPVGELTFLRLTFRRRLRASSATRASAAATASASRLAPRRPTPSY